jgi:3-deoxy-7-phosphoheptulonate synthase
LSAGSAKAQLSLGLFEREWDMIIKMKTAAEASDIEYVVARVHSLGLVTHLSMDRGQTLVGVMGASDLSIISALRGLRGVDSVLPTERPYRLASREYSSEPSVVDVGGVEVGAQQIVIMSGPCSVESRHLTIEAAHMAKNAGAQVLRGGAFKPRTSPYSFQGMALDGLKILAEAKKETGLPIVSEVMSPETVPMVAEYVDCLQIGTRNMANYPLLHAVGKVDKPVLLKRGMMSTIEEFLLSAEYILSQGNPAVILCERGIRTFETATRNTLDLSAVPVLKELSHLPVVVDPSHAAGKRSLVPSLSRAAVAAGADGLLIEMHQNPDKALSDGAQSVTPAQLGGLINDCRLIAQAIGRS